MTRDEHLEWCKKRARGYINRGDLTQAFTSMESDLGKHPDTQGHVALELGAALLMSGHLSTTRAMSEFIEGFN